MSVESIYPRLLLLCFYILYVCSCLSLLPEKKSPRGNVEFAPQKIPLLVAYGSPAHPLFPPLQSKRIPTRVMLEYMFSPFWKYTLYDFMGRRSWDWNRQRVLGTLSAKGTTISPMSCLRVLESQLRACICVCFSLVPKKSAVEKGMWLETLLLDRKARAVHTMCSVRRPKCLSRNGHKLLVLKTCGTALDVLVRFVTKLMRQAATS